MPRTRTARTVAVALVLLLLVAGALVLWNAWRVNTELRNAVQAATRLQTALEAGDQAAAQSSLEDVKEHGRSARDRTDSLLWSVLTVLPAVGDDARGISTVSTVVSDLADNGAEPLLATSESLGDLVPTDGRIAPGRVAALQAPVAQATGAFDRADQRLSALDPSGFLERFRTPFIDFETKVTRAHEALTSAKTATEVLPSMLGANGPRRYLLAFQNNAEARSTGGLPGAMSTITAVNGNIDLEEQVTAVSFGPRDAPLPLTDAERALYGPQLGIYIQDANFTPDFPRSAELMRARWNERSDKELDGVMSIDPVALSYILAVTGPVNVSGIQLSAENVVDELLNRVYLRLEDPVAQDEFFQDVARVVFDDVKKGGSSPEGLLRALGRAVDERRLYVASFDDAEQQAVAGTPIAGELIAPESDVVPHVGMYLNDATGSKMSYYLTNDVRLIAPYCRIGSQGLSGRATITSTAPANAAALPDSITGGPNNGVGGAGINAVNVRLYGPKDGRITDVRVNGGQLSFEVIRHEGRPVALVALSLAPQESAEVTWRMVSAPGQVGDPVLDVTPGPSPGTQSATVRSACG